MKVSLRADNELIKNPLVQWEILKQVLNQPHQITKQIKLGHIEGTIELAPSETASQALDFIKAQAKNPSRGEIDVIGEIAENMNDIHSKRLSKLNNDLESFLTSTLEKGRAYPREWFKPPLEVAKQAEKGLKLRAKYKRGGISTKKAGELGIGSGVQRAVDLKQREYLSPSTIKRMLSFFARHEKHKNNRNEKGEPTAGPIAWLLWGGDAGRAWAQRVKNKMDKFDKDK